MHRLIKLLVLLALLLPGSAMAQDEVTLAELEIKIWPEFDKPSVLVIYDITLPAEVSLPAQLSFRIPVNAEPNAVARQVDGSLFTEPYDLQVSGDWALVSFTAATPQLRLEYYDPGLEKNAPDRHYEYVWPGDYAVEALRIEVQQPTGASSLQVSPALGAGQTATDGMIYYSSEIGALKSGETFSLTVDYQKSDDELSWKGMPLQPSEPINSDTPGRLDFRKALPWVLGAAGILLLLGGAWWYWQSGHEDPRPTRTARGRRATANPLASGAAPAGGGVYCHNCGKRSGPSDKFCRSCGVKLRGE